MQKFAISYREHPAMWVINEKKLECTRKHAEEEACRLLERLRGQGFRKAIVYINEVPFDPEDRCGIPPIRRKGADIAVPGKKDRQQGETDCC